MTAPELTFGTAGIRGPVGPGPGKMNAELVERFARALGAFLWAKHPRGEEEEPSNVVIGFDARETSEPFATLISEVLSGMGFRTWVSEIPVPTPLLAFAVRRLDALAGVVVTASHNPKEDNGIKVYDERGAQISAPWDTEIAELMRDGGPRSASDETSARGRREQAKRPLPQAVFDDYFSYLERLGEETVPRTWARSAAPPYTLAYTPLHGVGLEFVTRALLRENVELTSVASQAHPDGGFPTVPFPNPEEPGALDALLRTADQSGARVAFANDPDADRFSLCLPLESSARELVRLDGDAVGLLFAEAALSAHGLGATVISTVVSSPQLEHLASRRGANVVRTLTGFKWMADAATHARKFAFAYEEALGYCFALPSGEVPVLDKDGVAAAVVLSRLLQKYGGAEGLVCHLMDLYLEVGQWGSFGFSHRFAAEGAMREMAAAMNAQRTHRPVALGGLSVIGVRDYLSDAERGGLPPQDLLELELLAEEARSSGEPVSGRVMIRPSGTEPKVKVYVHLLTPLKGHADYPAQRECQAATAKRVFEALFGSA